MIEIKNLSKVFQTSDGTVDALKNISLTIEDGDIYGIIGMSGAGKSTLVRCINMLERPTEGSVLIDKKNIGELSPKELRSIRREITMIFQGFNLLMQKTCLKNIMFPLKLAGVKTEEAKKKALELLEIVGLPDKANAYPAQLSGGQQQRIAIARALATQPKVLLCDEATSALDPKTTHSILELIRDINLSRLDHPNIVRVTDSFSENGTFYYVMDFIEGQNLNDYIKSHYIDEAEAVSIIKSVADALIYMHEEKHMLHLDLKPGNVMHRNSDGHVFLIDFGLSKHYSTDGHPETSTSGH